MQKDKKIAVMQPYFFPYVGYFQLIDAVDNFVIFDDVNYINRGWINRNRILLNDKDHFITLPLSKASQNKLISEIEITDDASIQKKKILEQIKHSYKKAISFREVYPIIEEIVLNQEKNLVKYLIYSIEQICDYLDIKFNYLLSSAIPKNNSLKGQSKIIDICKILDGNHYINPIGGTELYDRNYFLEKNIELKFIATRTIKYDQFNNDFIPYLSIIDLLMFNSKEVAKAFIKDYDLI